MRNEKPQRKNQDSTGGMGNFSSRDLFAHAVNTYGTSFMQIHIIRQLPKVFDKLTFFMQNKANFIKDKINATFFVTKDYENEPRRQTTGKQTQTKPISKAKNASAFDD